MTMESIAVPAERVPPVASDMASSSKTLAGVLLFFCAIMAVAMIGVVTGDQNYAHDDYQPADSAEAAGHAVGMVFGIGLIAGLPGLFGFRAARNGSRATRAGNVAKNDPTYTWRLSGNYIIAADGRGAPHPELSFKVNGKLRTMLLALPRGAVVDRA